MLFIGIYAAGMPFNHETIDKGESLGGSESAAYYMALELAKLGNKVIVFTSHREGGSKDGVTFQYHGEMSEQAPLGDLFMRYALNAPIDVLVMQRHPMSFHFPYNSKLNIFWLHDLALKRNLDMVNPSLLNIDKVFTVSEFHRKQVSETYDIPEENVYATANGVDTSLYPKDKILPLEKREPRTLLYSSRPERGLANLVGENGIMEELKDCHLYVCGYDNTTPQMAEFYNYLWRRCEELPNVTNLGALSKRELADLQRRVTLYAYATEFEETSCITAMESMLAGTPFVGSRKGALAETLKDGGAHLVRLKDGKFNKQGFIDGVRRILKDDSYWNKLHNKALTMSFDWESVAKDWVKLFESELRKKSGNALRLCNHFERMSDIVALCKYKGVDKYIGNMPLGLHGDKAEEAKAYLAAIDEISAAHPGLWKNYHFLFTGKFREHYEAYYKYEKDRGVVYGPEALHGNPRFEEISRQIGKLLEARKNEAILVNKELCKLDTPTASARMQEKPKLRILDYGCAHGHYVMNLAWKFQNQLEIVGVDLEDTNIEKATQWMMDAVREGMNEDIRFVAGDSSNMEKYDLGEFDVIIAAEVLEHTPDPKKVVNALRMALKPSGTMIISTPFGAWEAIGYEQHEGWRAHLHHFERADLFELFGAFTGYSLSVVPHTEGLGHFVATFQPKPEEEVGEIDYSRKFTQQAPRETLTCTLIVKDAEYSVGRTLSKLKGVYDELIVGVDKTTTDDTRRVLEKFNAKIIDIESPLKQGFDGARNEVIKHATCDWVLWIDDDETFEGAHFLKKKYLRANCFDAYSVPQHHYAQQPAMLFQTDFPTRLFRNRLGIKFFGLVHEHPELDLNKGIGKVAIIGDVGIMHIGYATEEIRRKRFDRNFPLIQEDRKRYPDRILGKYLWMRDLSHIIMYDVEQAQIGMRPLDMNKLQNIAREIVEIWRWLLKEKHMRMVRDGLPFYTNAVDILTQNQGINYAFNMGASKLNGGAKLQDRPLVANFMTQTDIKNLNNALVEELTDAYEEKYY